MKKKFSSESLREMVYGMPEFGDIGDDEPGLSLPLIAGIDGESYVVFFVFTDTDETPGAFVLCKDGADPEYLEYEEGLDKFGIRDEDIDIFAIPDDDNEAFRITGDYDEYIEPSESEVLPAELFERFDKAYKNGKPDIKAYREYLDIVISQSPDELHKYLLLFR